MHGREDLPFLERVFQKLLLNFTWFGIWLSTPCFSPDAIFDVSGGLTAKTLEVIMFLKEVSSDSIILERSIDQSLSQLAAPFARQMVQHGWRFIV